MTKTTVSSFENNSTISLNSSKTSGGHNKGAKSRVYRKLVAFIFIAGSAAAVCSSVAAMNDSSAIDSKSFRGVVTNQTRRLSAIGNEIIGYINYPYYQESKKYFARGLTEQPGAWNAGTASAASSKTAIGSTSSSHEDRFLIFDPEDA